LTTLLYGRNPGKANANAEQEGRKKGKQERREEKRKGAAYPCIFLQKRKPYGHPKFAIPPQISCLLSFLTSCSASAFFFIS
jgi:hypothetical protein